MYMAKIIHLAQVDSTQTYLKTHFSELEDQTIVYADTQTAGRGRFNRRWISQDGGLYFSVLLKPVQTRFSANLTQLMALCVCRAVEKYGVRANLKWPNDVQVNGRKLCGMLSEAVMDKQKIACVIVGVGVNIAQADLSHVGQPAVSLAQLGVNTDKETFLHDIMQFFWQDYPSVCAAGFSAVRGEYLKRFPFTGKTISVRNGESMLSGEVAGVSAKGTLVLSTADGQKEVYIGDVIL